MQDGLKDTETQLERLTRGATDYAEPCWIGNIWLTANVENYDLAAFPNVFPGHAGASSLHFFYAEQIILAKLNDPNHSGSAGATAGCLG